MVGSDDDESLVGMLLIEVVCHPHSIVHINQFGYKRQVVGMTSPVDLAALNHHEESVLLSLFFHEEVNAGTRDVGEGQVAILAVEGVWYAVSVGLACLLALQQNHPLATICPLLIVGIATGDGVSLGFGLVI